MDRETKRRILRNSALYGIFAALLLWLIYFNDLTIGDFSSFLPYLPDQLASTSISVVLLPLLVSMSIFYAASLFGAAFEGVFNELLVGSLYATGFAAFFALFLIYSPGSEMLNSAGYLFLAAFAVLLIYNALAALSRFWKVHALRALAASATIYVEGQIAMMLLGLFLGSSGLSLPGELGGALNELLDLGFMVAAAVSLLAVLKTSHNPYLSTVGGVASNYILVVSTSLTGSLYFNYFRGRLAAISPGIANLSPYIEWTTICIVAALIYTKTRRSIQASMTAEAQLGDWIKHVQEISTYKGDRFVGFTEMINDFIERGRRDRLLVRLAMFLHENRVVDDEISLLLSELINHEDAKKPVFSLSERASALEKENEARRRGVLQRTISRIMPMGLGVWAGMKELEPEDVDRPTGDSNIGPEESPPSIGSSVNMLKMEGVRDEG